MTSWSVEDTLSIDLEDVREVDLGIVAGEVAVTATDGPAHLEVERISGPPVEVELVDGRLRIHHPKREGLLELLDRFGGSGKPEASVVLAVPSGARLRAKAVSAPVLVSGLGARTSVKTVSGDLTLKDLADEVDVKTVSGDVEAKGVTADLKAGTVSGSVTLVDGACRWVRVKTVSGDVLLDLDLDPSGVYDLGTVSGDVALRTGADPSVVVEAQSVSGAVVSDFGLDWDELRPGRRVMRRRVGSGEARLAVKTVSGELRLVRRREAAA